MPRVLGLGLELGVSNVVLLFFYVTYLEVETSRVEVGSVTEEVT